MRDVVMPALHVAAGLIMWVSASITYLLAGLVLLARWMRESGLRVARYQAVGGAR